MILNLAAWGVAHVEWAGARAGMAMLRTAARERINARLRVGETHVEWAGARAGMAMLRTAARQTDHSVQPCSPHPNWWITRRGGGSIYIYIFMYTYIHTYIHIYICTCMYMYKCSFERRTSRIAMQVT